MIKKISELNKTVHPDGDYVVIFDDANIAASFGVNLDSAHVCTIENGELKLKDFEPAKYEEVQRVEGFIVEVAAESMPQAETALVPTLTAATSQIVVDTLEAKIEPKPSLIKRLFLGKVIK